MIEIKSRDRIWSVIPRIALLFVVVIPCLVVEKSAGDEPNNTKEVKAELDKLRGSWEVKSAVVDGRTMPGGGHKIEFGDHRYSEQFEEAQFGVMSSGPVRFDYDFELDVKASPMIMRTNMVTSEKEKLRTVLKIFRIHDQELQICFNIFAEKQGVAPSKFDGSAGSGQMLITLTRTKKKTKKETALN